MKIDMTRHVTIIGETQSGKTVLANYLFQKTGGLFVDIEDLGDIEADITLTRRNTSSFFLKALQIYRRVRYVPSPNFEFNKKEILFIWRLVKTLNKNLYVYVDEIQNWGGARKNVFDVYAIRGLKYGIHLVSISQRPANISKSIATQTKTFIFFDISEMESQYFKLHQLPYEEIKRRLMDAPRYAFVVYVRGEGVSQPYKIRI